LWLFKASSFNKSQQRSTDFNITPLFLMAGNYPEFIDLAKSGESAF